MVGKTIQIGDEGRSSESVGDPDQDAEEVLAPQTSGQSSFLLLFVVAVLIGVVGGGAVLGVVAVAIVYMGGWPI